MIPRLFAALLGFLPLFWWGTDCWAKPSLSGLQFPVGQPADQPAAKVAIQEVTQGSQKRGFLRVALLPLAAANGVQIHFLRPDPAVFLEISATLRSLTQLEAQEFHRIELYAPGDSVPRFVATEASVTPEGWVFKRAVFRYGAAPLEMAECSLVISGPSAGQFLAKPQRREAPPETSLPLPTLNALLQVVP